MRRVPTTILTGFLGAGKTTLLKRLLDAAPALRVGVLLNEIGAAGIDGTLGQHEAFVELSESCVCCVQSPDLNVAMETLLARGDLDRIVIETTGLADPLPLVWRLEAPGLGERVLLDAVVAVIDPHTRQARDAEEWQAQIHCADLVIFSKADLVEEGERAQAEAEVRRLNSKARFVDSTDASVVDLVFNVRPAPRPPTLRSRQAVARHSSFTSWDVISRERHRQDALEDLLEALPAEVFRAKGIVAVEGGRWLAFHVVAGRVQRELDAPAPPHGESRVVVFGRGLDGPAVERAFAATRIPRDP